jgi:hypothetical protein
MKNYQKLKNVWEFERAKFKNITKAVSVVVAAMFISVGVSGCKILINSCLCLIKNNAQMIEYEYDNGGGGVR